MNQKEFKKICESCGYAKKDTVEEYCWGKYEFGDEDFVAVYRLQNRKNDAADRTLHGKWHMVYGVKTTKCYQNKGSDNQ